MHDYGRCMMMSEVKVCNCEDSSLSKQGVYVQLTARMQLQEVQNGV